MVVYPDPEKVMAIAEMKAPSDKAELQRFLGMVTFVVNNNNNNCLKSNIQCIEIRVQWTVHLGELTHACSAVTRVHAVTPKLVICVMYLTSI